MRGKPQNGDAYDGHVRITVRDFEDHLFGGAVWAVACVAENGANFLAFDCDQQFPQRLPIYARVLERRGLAQAAFTTTGSTPGRGKVVVTLAQRVPHAFAVELAQRIQAEVVAEPDFGEVEPNALTPFPSKGDGSYCRILGRKYDPGVGQAKLPGALSPFEVMGDLQGHPCLPSAIVPAKITPPAPTIALRHDRHQHNLSAWTQVILTQPFSGTEPELLKVQLRLANEAINIFGDEADAQFTQWMEVIHKNSPGLSGSCHRQLFRADAFRKAKVHITAKGAPSPTWSPLWTPYIPGVTYKVSESENNAGKLGVYKVSGSARRVYDCLAAYAMAHGLNAHAIGMDHQRLADLAGYMDKGAVPKAVAKAEKAGIMHRLHKGSPRTKDSRGSCTLFCLRGEGETMEQAITSGKQSKRYLARTETTQSAPLQKPDFLGALTWDELREANRAAYDDVCDALRRSRYLPEHLTAQDTGHPQSVAEDADAARHAA